MPKALFFVSVAPAHTWDDQAQVVHVDGEALADVLDWATAQIETNDAIIHT